MPLNVQPELEPCKIPFPYSVCQDPSNAAKESRAKNNLQAWRWVGSDPVQVAINTNMAQILFVLRPPPFIPFSTPQKRHFVLELGSFNSLIIMLL